MPIRQIYTFNTSGTQIVNISPTFPDWGKIIFMKMKNVVIYSPDFSLCYSLLMYLQTQYKVVATTDLDVVSSLIGSNSADLVIMDTEPTAEVQIKCEQFRKLKAEIPLILTYVYNNRVKEAENRIKRFVNEIFYKPFDLNEISLKIPTLLTSV